METCFMLRALCAGNHRSLVDFPHKSQWHRALMFSLIWAWTNVWVKNRYTSDLRSHRTHYDVTVMTSGLLIHACIKFDSLMECNTKKKHQNWLTLEEPWDLANFISHLEWHHLVVNISIRAIATSFLYMAVYAELCEYIRFMAYTPTEDGHDLLG